MSSYIDTIIVGGGQAGLSVSWHLKAAGQEHIILDRGNIGDTWRNRWDNFCLVTPNRLCRLPGFSYEGNDPNGFMLRDQIVDYVERFAESFDPPYRGGIDVERISACEEPGCFKLETSAGEFRTKNLIVTVGTHQHPNIPEWDHNFSTQITRLHTRDYRNSDQLPTGAVLVVGSGQSGCQVAEDLLTAGREVHLCTGNAGRIPRRYRGHDIFDWDIATGYMEMPVDQHPKGNAIRFMAHPHLSGRDGGHTIDLRKLAQDGVQLYGKVSAAKEAVVRLAGNLAETLDAIDSSYQTEVDSIDTFIAEQGLNEVQNEIMPTNWQPGPEPHELDLIEAGISTVIYATGFHFDFSWIDLPVFDGRGYPEYQRGITDINGLYFVGLHWMYTQGSGLFYGVGRDAKYVARHLIHR